MENAVPIITANYRPLRFVLINDTDFWIPTIEQINNRDYDYVKLHRMSTYFDIGIAPYSLGICFDGTLVLPAIPKYYDASHALTLFNRTLSELLLGGVYCEAVTPDDIGYGSLTFTAYTRIIKSGWGPSVSFHTAARLKVIGPLDSIKLLKPETITIDELHTSLKTGRELISRLGEIPREQILYGTTFYVRKQWAESLIHIWTIIERITELTWQKYVVNPFASSKKRREFLDDHRTWPVSTKLEVLFQKKLLPVSTCDMLEEVRKARNNFAHYGKIPTYDTASKALRGCFELASLCASDFESEDLFEQVVSQVVKRCNLEILPQKRMLKLSELEYWLPCPPIPGDKEWGDREYEIVDDLCLKPIAECIPNVSNEQSKANH